MATLKLGSTTAITESSGTISIPSLGGATVINTSGAITTTGAFTSVGITDGAVGATAITIDADENVGIGGAPNAKLDVNGSILIGDSKTSVPTQYSNHGKIERSVLTIPANSATQIATGYGGKVCMLQWSGVTGNAQGTFVVSHSWSSASVLYGQDYSGAPLTYTFSSSSGNLYLQHNHSDSIRIGILMISNGGSS